MDCETFKREDNYSHRRFPTLLTKLQQILTDLKNALL